MFNRINPACELEVDGAVDSETIDICASQGANVLVAGTSVFGSPNGPRTAIGDLPAVVREAARQTKLRSSD